MKIFEFIFIIISALLSTFGVATAHEVYVLSPEAVHGGMAAAPLNVVAIITTHFGDFMLWGFLMAMLVGTMFFVSISRRLEEKSSGFFVGIKRYAPLMVRLTLGASFVNAALHGAFLGPELSFSEFFGVNAGFFSGLLGVAGVLMFVGLWVRISALIGLMFFALAVAQHGVYLLTYMDYLGAMTFLLLTGTHEPFFERMMHTARVRPPALHRLTDALRKFGHEYGFLILRVGFGASLMYASYYGKYLHSGLAFATVNDFGLDKVFGFDAEFVVLGAFILEMMLGVFFILGFELRFAVVVAATFLTLSQLYFREAVWPHLVLFGLATAIFMHGYDRYTFGGRFFKKGIREPAL